jgi:hypothetical protein
MSKKKFEDLLDKHKTESEEKKIDWEKEKSKWIHFISQFYSTVESWFEPYKSAGKLSYEYQKIIISEDHIGNYETNVMIVDFAGQKLTMEPIGTLLIGTKGRIDMEGTRGRVQFILTDKENKGMKVSVSTFTNGEPPKKQKEKKEIDWIWKIVLKEARRVSFEEFNEDNFFSALMEIVNG